MESISEQGDRTEAVHDGLAQLAPRAHELLAGLRRVPAVAGSHRDYGLAAHRIGHSRQRGKVHERDRGGHLVRKVRDPAAVEVENLLSLLDREVDAPAVDGGKGVEGKFEGGDDAVVAAATLEAPEEIRVLVGARFDQLAVGRDHFGLAHALGGEPILAPKPTEPAAQCVADDADP